MSTWTIDSIAHALPHPELRANFMREINLSPVDHLQAVIGKWVGVIERLEAELPRIEELRAYAKAHDGHLPPEYEATLIDVSVDELQALVERRDAA